jgi:hemolysin activation/secretion protein
MANQRFKLKHTRCVLVLAGVVGIPALSHAQTAPTPQQTQEQIQQQQEQQSKDRAKAIQDQQPAAPDVRLTLPATEAPITQLPIAETPSFQIKQIQLTGDSAEQFKFALYQALKQTKLHPIGGLSGTKTEIATDEQFKNTSAGMQIGVPLGAKGINALMTAAQNAVIARGYTTTRILAEPQDLKSGLLTLTVIPGRVRHINVDTSNIAQTHADRAILFNALPIKEGDILNLRDIEQGLENLKRVPTVEADVKIAPANTPNQSDINISWQQKLIPLRLNLSYDDSGSRSTGKYQGGVTLSVDSPFRLSDLFYFNYGQGLSGYHRVNYTDITGQTVDTRHGDTQNWALHYSIPFGYWEFALNASSYDYDQAVAGINQIYSYSGHSKTQDIKLTRLIHRDANSKDSLYLKGWSRFSDNFINDAEITVQRRKTAGYELGWTHKHNIKNIQLDTALAYKRGTGANNALPAPEEAFGEGTSRMKLITADLGISIPWQIHSIPMSLSSNWRAQWNKTPLTPQDRIAIGGRSTVRGFDGEMTLSAERGWYGRNELSVSYRPTHQIYWAVDAGHVSGWNAQYLLGQTLVGTAIGLRGQFKLGGNLSYDLFVGTPLRKPQSFPTADAAYGFNLNYAF